MEPDSSTQEMKRVDPKDAETEAEAEVLKQLEMSLPMSLRENDGEPMSQFDLLKTSTTYMWLLSVCRSLGGAMDDDAFELGLRMIRDARAASWETSVVDLKAYDAMFDFRDEATLVTLKRGILCDPDEVMLQGVTETGRRVVEAWAGKEESGRGQDLTSCSSSTLSSSSPPSSASTETSAECPPLGRTVTPAHGDRSAPRKAGDQTDAGGTPKGRERIPSNPVKSKLDNQLSSGPTESNASDQIPLKPAEFKDGDRMPSGPIESKLGDPVSSGPTDSKVCNPILSGSNESYSRHSLSPYSRYPNSAGTGYQGPSSDKAGPSTRRAWSPEKDYREARRSNHSPSGTQESYPTNTSVDRPLSVDLPRSVGSPEWPQSSPCNSEQVETWRNRNTELAPYCHQVGSSRDVMSSWDQNDQHPEYFPRGLEWHRTERHVDQHNAMTSCTKTLNERGTSPQFMTSQNEEFTPPVASLDGQTRQRPGYDCQPVMSRIGELSHHMTPQRSTYSMAPQWSTYPMTPQESAYHSTTGLYDQAPTPYNWQHQVNLADNESFYFQERQDCTSGLNPDHGGQREINKSPWNLENTNEVSQARHRLNAPTFPDGVTLSTSMEYSTPLNYSRSMDYSTRTEHLMPVDYTKCHDRSGQTNHYDPRNHPGQVSYSAQMNYPATVEDSDPRFWRQPPRGRTGDDANSAATDGNSTATDGNSTATGGRPFPFSRCMSLFPRSHANGQDFDLSSRSSHFPSSSSPSSFRRPRGQPRTTGSIASRSPRSTRRHLVNIPLSEKSATTNHVSNKLDSGQHRANSRSRGHRPAVRAPQRRRVTRSIPSVVVTLGEGEDESGQSVPPFPESLLLGPPSAKTRHGNGTTKSPTPCPSNGNVQDILAPTVDPRRRQRQGLPRNDATILTTMPTPLRSSTTGDVAKNATTSKDAILSHSCPKLTTATKPARSSSNSDAFSRNDAPKDANVSTAKHLTPLHASRTPPNLGHGLDGGNDVRSATGTCPDVPTGRDTATLTTPPSSTSSRSQPRSSALSLLVNHNDSGIGSDLDTTPLQGPVAKVNLRSLSLLKRRRGDSDELILPDEFLQFEASL